MSEESKYIQTPWDGQYPEFQATKQVASVDMSDGYDMEALHLFKLKRGYALVYESGCSCYSSDEADVDFYPSLQAVKNKLFEATKGGGSYADTCSALLKEIKFGKKSNE